ncbi:hypothetical protein [Vreelandella neptunia]|uniref:hypothetical protein n=1 Tax=Vreelandella neptunia TaxID=115551 RepID=UPI00315A396A
MKYLREFLLCLIVGGAPLAVFAFFHGSESMIDSFTSISPSDEVVLYLFSLFLIHCVLYGLNKFLLKRPSIAELVPTILKFTHDAGFAIHSIYRAAVGAIPTVLAIMAYQHNGYVPLKVLLLSVLFTSAGLVMCVFFSWMDDKTKPREPAYN